MPYSAAEVGELVRRAGRLDQVGREQRVVGGVDARRLCIVHHELAFGLRGTLAADDHAFGGRDGGPVVERRVADPAREVELALAPADGDARDLRGRRGERLVERVEAREQAAELEPAEDLLELRAVGRGEHELAGIEVEVEVAPHRGELLREPSLVGVLGDGARARGRELAGVLDHRLERAERAISSPGRLVADPGDARDVVGRVALETDEVGHLVRADAVAGLDTLGGVDLDVGDPARGHHQRDVLRAELERVAVGRDDARAQPLGVGVRRERGDDVVRLPALELEVLVAERLDDRPEARELLAQQLRHRAATFLVDDVGGLGELGPVHGPRVPRHRHRLRAVVGEQLEQHVREPEQRAGRHPLGRGELLGQREEGAVGEVVAVDEEDVGVAYRSVVELQLLAGQGLR